MTTIKQHEPEYLPTEEEIAAAAERIRREGFTDENNVHHAPGADRPTLKRGPQSKAAAAKPVAPSAASVAQSKPLTERQQEALDFITRYVEENGFPPSFREIAAGLKLASFSGVAERLRALEKKGCLTYGSEARSIRLLRPDRCPLCGNAGTEVAD